ncbi:hypothetical protein N3K66_004041 [Trichothecium roseum]|uniref:Uncharacterized protein n=1 Tax=Trichothecium roseum TaxID=47278 RepID=A0ACC0V927_9HYPO|nr:hypothetical protein N3K66_004041 [Trichothecium roseum]
MKSISSLVSLGLFGAVAARCIARDTLPGCGEVNVFYTGLPGFHKYVREQGFNTTLVDKAIRASADAMVQAGYNVKIVLAGPEQDQDEWASHIDEDITWDITGIGNGMRSASIPEVITKFEDNLITFKEKVPEAPTVFNYNADSFLWSIQRRAPLASDCADSPGTLYDYIELCQEACEEPEE